jgi:hypothetical protein
VKIRARIAVISIVLCAAAPPSFAARPMITDDARIAEPKACQLESWVKRNVDSTEWWAMPACNPTGNLEITFGGGWVTQGGSTFFAQNVAQVKTVFKPVETNGWGYGLSVGSTRHLDRNVAEGWPGDAYFYVPASFSFLDDAWTAHLNAGVTRRRDLKENLGTWGFGNEIRLRDDLYFIPEIFRNDFGHPFYQMGLRYTILKDRIQTDATFGNRLSSGTQERWFGIGLRLLWPPFIP